MKTPELAIAYAHCAQLLRSEHRDAWLTSLFVPQSARPHVQALAAFSHEISQIRDKVSGPMPGEIRLQWWRDIIEQPINGDAAAHPVAAALNDTIRAFALPHQPFDDMIEARITDLYDDPVPDLPALEFYCGAVFSARFALNCLILSGSNNAASADAAGHAGMAVGLVDLLRRLPINAARQQVFVPQTMLREYDISAVQIIAEPSHPRLRPLRAGIKALAYTHLRKAEVALVAVPALSRAGFLELALVAPRLRLAPSKADISPLRQQWAIWRYARSLA